MENRPNVLMICTDHWPGSFLQCAGKDDLMTPTLNTLAKNGVRFDRLYSECPVCIPARRCLMTGMSPRSHGDRVFSDHMPMPDAVTLAQAFRNAGYQAMAVGKLHVYPQRDRIGFDDVILQEEGRYEFGGVDDYQLWLGDQGFVGQEFLHSMGSNTYLTRNWHLPEYTHPTNWATAQMMRQIKRKDPTRPAFFYISYQFPHPPLVPLPEYWDMYTDEEIDMPVVGDWADREDFALRQLREQWQDYSEKEIRRARRAFYAQCTHIDNQIRLLIGTLRETSLLDNTLIVFLSDHGDMLFDHKLAAKRCFYENSARVPLILSGPPVEHLRGTVDDQLGCLMDVMPTVLTLCGLPVPETVDGQDLLGEDRREAVYGEVGEGPKATRMYIQGRYKLIYYPYGNTKQLFDLEADPQECRDLGTDPAYESILCQLEQGLISQLYGEDLTWVQDGMLKGLPAPEWKPKVDYGLYNQRGHHWPPPGGYANRGNNA